jgi:hypothetical protein
MWIGIHVKYPLFLSNFNESLIFLTDCQKNTRLSNFIKIRPVAAKLFQADRQTDIMKLIIAFHNFANMPRNRKQHFLTLIIFVSNDHSVLLSMFPHNIYEPWSETSRCEADSPEWSITDLLHIITCVSYIKCLSHYCWFVSCVHRVKSPWCNCHGFSEQKKCKKVNCIRV